MPELSEVFGINADVRPLSYIDRGGLDRGFQTALQSDEHIIVHGDSKQGKSWLLQENLSPNEYVRVYCTPDSTLASILEEGLGRLGIDAEVSRTHTSSYQVNVAVHAETQVPIIKAGARSEEATGNSDERQFVPVGRSTEDLSWICEQFYSKGVRLIIEDFHYLRFDERRKVAFSLKAMGEMGLYPVIVGVWPEDHMLVYLNGDLAGRLADIHLEWTREELAAVLEKGAEALGVGLAQTLQDELIEDAFGNVGILQRLARDYMRCAGVLKTSHTPRRLRGTRCLDEARERLVQTLAGRFLRLSRTFPLGAGDSRTPLPSYIALWRALLSSDDETLLSGWPANDLRIAARSEASDATDQSLGQAIQTINAVQVRHEISPPVFHYDELTHRVAVVDRQILLFRRYDTSGLTDRWLD